MQRKQIKVGERYAVVKRMGRDAHIDKSVPATVEEMGVEYKTSRWGSFHSHTVTMNDGIRVRFDEPMVVRHFDFEPLSRIVERGALKEYVIAEHRKQAVTEYVLPGSKHVLRPQAEVDEMRARWDKERQERAVKIDGIGDAVEPVYNAVQLELAERGVKFEYKASTQPGTEKKRLIDATFHFDLDEMATLLGVSVKP